MGGRGATGRAPKRIRPASVGRRPPSIALAGGLGLLGLLLTIGIMAVLSTRSVSGTDDATDLLEGRLPAELTTTTADTTTADPTTAPGAPLDPAAAVVCEANRDVLETAVRAHELTNGAPPPDQQVLVAAGLLEEPVTTHELVAGAGGVTVAGIGECAGR